MTAISTAMSTDKPVVMSAITVTTTTGSLVTTVPSDTAASISTRIRQVEDLLASSARTLVEASLISDPSMRYVTAHLGALRAAAAVLAARAVPERGMRRRRPVRNTWVLLPTVAPELTEWAEFFSATATMRAAVEAGVRHVSVRAADDLVRDAEVFLGVTRRLLHLPHQSPQLR
jgi:hypothetical protein